MSLVIAEVTDGAVQMSADTQLSWTVCKAHSMFENNLKIVKMPHGILMGAAGDVKAARMLFCHKDWFEELGDEKLCKEFLIMEIVPKLYETLDGEGLLKEDHPAEHPNTFIFAQGDRLFLMNGDFSVQAVPKSIAIGCGKYAAEIVNEYDKELPVRERMLKALRLASKIDNAVGAPYVFIDTKKLELEFVEE